MYTYVWNKKPRHWVVEGTLNQNSPISSQSKKVLTNNKGKRSSLFQLQVDIFRNKILHKKIIRGNQRHFHATNN